MTDKQIRRRLAYLKRKLRSKRKRISLNELCELDALSEILVDDDAEPLEAAGVEDGVDCE